MWLRLLVLAVVLLVPVVGASAQSGAYPYPPGGQIPGQLPGLMGGQGMPPPPGTIDIAALLKKGASGKGGWSGALKGAHGTTPMKAPATPQAAPKAPAAKTPATGATASKTTPGDKTKTTATAKDKSTSADGKKDGDAATGADSEKIDPALLVQVPTRELPEEANAFPAVAEGELTTDRILREFQSIDANHDGALSYLEARDRSQIDLTSFRQFDADNSGLLDTQEFESHMVLIASSRGQPIERTLKTRVDSFVSKKKAQLDEEKSKATPAAASEKLFEYYDSKLQNIVGASGQPNKANIPRPAGLPPRSPRNPRLPAY